jgi:hypothetical protein
MPDEPGRNRILQFQIKAFTPFDDSTPILGRAQKMFRTRRELQSIVGQIYLRTKTPPYYFSHFWDIRAFLGSSNV